MEIGSTLTGGTTALTVSVTTAQLRCVSPRHVGEALLLAFLGFTTWSLAHYGIRSGPWETVVGMQGLNPIRVFSRVRESVYSC